VSAELIAAIVVTVAFTFTSGVHDAADAVATLVATRAARPGPALLMTIACTMVGPLLLGAAVAGTVEDLLALPDSMVVAVIGAALTGAVVWNVVSWRMGLPSSSTHALVGGLVGAALLAQGTGAVSWGTLAFVLAGLVATPLLGFLVGLTGQRAASRSLRRANTRVRQPVRWGQWVGSATLSVGHGANDAAKSAGVIVVLLVATGHAQGSTAPLWVTLLAAASLTLGTAAGGWQIVRTVGMQIYRLRLLDGFVSQTGSSLLVLGASAVGAPVSTSQVVASSVAGVGSGRRWHHVNWLSIRDIGIAWLLTMPACATLAAVTYPVWDRLT
jgi:PiT family inorganic phosphate transporter